MSMKLHLTAMGYRLPHGITCHPTQVNAPTLTPARQAGTWFTYPRRLEGISEGWKAELT